MNEKQLKIILNSMSLAIKVFQTIYTELLKQEPVSHK